MFLYFLDRNNALLIDGKKTIADYTLVALTIMIAESKPEERVTSSLDVNEQEDEELIKDLKHLPAVFDIKEPFVFAGERKPPQKAKLVNKRLIYYRDRIIHRISKPLAAQGVSLFFDVL